MEVERTGSISYRPSEDHLALARELRRLDARQAARRLVRLDAARAAAALELLNPASAVAVLWELDEKTRAAIAAALPDGRGEQWLQDHAYPKGTVGRLMENPRAVFRPTSTVGEAIDRLRELVKNAFISYGFLTDDDGRLVGVFAFRELLFAERTQKVGDIAIPDPFSLRPETRIVDAMHEVVTRHYPAYPVCDDTGRLLGMVRGQAIFEAESFEISAQAGKMQGVDQEERISTPWPRSLRFRHPWLQVNLLTSFLAAGVVGYFQGTIDRVVVLAAFLPVLMSQASNTGCQALAVTLRGMSLGELKRGGLSALFNKETLLGGVNGLVTGVVAGLGMWIYAVYQGTPSPIVLGAVVGLAMFASCLASGVFGAVVPLALRRLGADPATASSIVLTTITDVASMAAFLALATWSLAA